MDGRDEADGRLDVASHRRPLLPVLLAGLVALAVVAGAALSGPWQVAPRDVTPGPPTTEREEPSETPTAPEEPPPDAADVSFPLTMVLALVGLLLLALLLRALVRRATLARGTSGGRYEHAPGSVEDLAPAPPEPDLPALRRGVTAARALLVPGADPDDAVIAAWLELEAAAASSGVDRAPSDTPTEFTTAVLDATRADPDATRRLLRLYHLARFAPHAVLTSDDVAEARRCLERLAESWDER